MRGKNANRKNFQKSLSKKSASKKNEWGAAG